jgi:effector-binding domain-containing protein
MISEQKMDIEKSRKDYYRYLNQIYEEISEFLRSEDGAVNAQKLEMMFEKTASPYVYWLKENHEPQAQTEMSPEARATLLKSLERKYHLVVEEANTSSRGS